MDLFRKKTIANILRDAAQTGEDGQHALGKHLGARDLTAFGIAAIIGAGIFSTIGNASASGGPGVVLLFIFTAIACSFAAFAYAEFASLVPVSGSAYTYSYVAFGELIAWIIGWALIMEYGIGNITIAISWSDYFTGLMQNFGIHIPGWASMDFLTAYNGHNDAVALMQKGTKFANLDSNIQTAYTAYVEAPHVGLFHFVADIPALAIIVIITAVVYRGMRESRNASNLMVAIKLCVVLLVIAVGVFYVDTANWTPFLPNGIPGVLKGVSAVFFAYIGFDAISTTAEECRDPQRDLPKGMMWAIIICTILYVIIALVLTGMVNYSQLGVGDPLAFVFDKLDLKWMSFIIGTSAIVAMASVLLVFQMGQPRIWMSMSRDGLLPKKFSTVHPKYRTPSFATIVTGFVVAVPALFMNLTMVTDLCSIGTLFAFVLVCGGVLRLQMLPNPPERKFKTPYVNSRHILPFFLVGGIVLAIVKFPDTAKTFILNTPKPRTPEEVVTKLDPREMAQLRYQVSMYDAKAFARDSGDVVAVLSKLDGTAYTSVLNDSPIAEDKKFESGYELFKHKIPTWIFLITALLLSIAAIAMNMSVIPVMGLLSCLYMMSEMSFMNWRNFFIWLLLGLIVYFTYGNKHSHLNKLNTKEPYA